MVNRYGKVFENLTLTNFKNRYVVVPSEGPNVLRVRSISKPFMSKYNNSLSRLISFYGITTVEMQKALTVSNANKAGGGSIPIGSFDVLKYVVSYNDNPRLYNESRGLLKGQKINVLTKMHTRKEVIGASPKLIITQIAIPYIEQNTIPVHKVFEDFEKSGYDITI